MLESSFGWSAITEGDASRAIDNAHALVAETSRPRLASNSPARGRAAALRSSRGVLVQVVKGGNKKSQELMPVEFDDVDLNLAGKPEALVVEQRWVRADLLGGEGVHSPRGEGRIVRFAVQAVVRATPQAQRGGEFFLACSSQRFPQR
jgi:hypothetical protein